MADIFLQMKVYAPGIVSATSHAPLYVEKLEKNFQNSCLFKLH